jgi:hypothetical protein
MAQDEIIQVLLDIVPKFVLHIPASKCSVSPTRHECQQEPGCIRLFIILRMCEGILVSLV